MFDPSEFHVPDSPFTTQMPISAIDRQRRSVLGVVAKRSYAVDPHGRCTPLAEQAPLNLGPVDDPEHRELILADSDVFLDKLAVDLVVRGHAWNHPGTPSWLAEVLVDRGAFRAQLQVHGDRRAGLSQTGRIAFSPPARVDKVALSYRNAYGGCDERGEARRGFPFEPMLAGVPESERDLARAALSLWHYPRNRAGKGYLVEFERESLDALELPNLEHPHDLLTPERLVVGDMWHWPLQPLPASFDWLDHGTFPRLGWFGDCPDWEDVDLAPSIDAFPELRFGHAERELFDPDNTPAESFDRRALNGASLGMRVAQLRGDELLTLTNLHPSLPQWLLQLPGERPKLWVDDRQGSVRELEAKLSSVLIEPDEQRLTLVWYGWTPARRPYLEHELIKMPYLVEW
ncbi:hypothetical protein PPSIR1_24974 [Plesiocystis pacifica SIR-1]|uniref:DUF2169 domain-containing protein n=1 Tax=Plesiocystis pacifica SIR-1 TaxID=391625 RepID=A6G9I9_9BACT|nr:DUF2169 domain-containing protein [Plesiocystis pacifica]EDM77497.1 hypothetical protein PPSIR1_24974 [Plesiocystis pacifica SIR-1]